jgi:hemolysin-activating ACP:hemolysin acyltransferase
MSKTGTVNGIMARDATAVVESEMAVPAEAVSDVPRHVAPEVVAQIAALRSRVQQSMGQIVLAIMNLPRYRHQTLGDLAHIVVDPLLRDRLAIAHNGVTAEDGTTRVDEDSIAGLAIWASVSDEVDARITEQVRAGVFPVRLGSDDWVSGDNVWLLDVIAGDRQATTSVLANFRQVAGDRVIKIHPIVARLIDPAVLEKLRGAA